ncbi:ABC transporter ATP-binding protein [Candidatus Poribacteria bacterium]|nr:ABC transporter ATP-binding protein [Candidatus Poribacteria bacterium]
MVLPEYTLKLQNVTKVFEDAQKGKMVAVDDVSFTVEKGQLVTLLGPSGCGKTTALKMIGGFEIPTSGEIYFDDVPMDNTPPNKRKASMVFQNYALFPHMTVFKNIAYGLTVQKMPKAQIIEKVKGMMARMGLEGLENRVPAELSGGQQQRVALARALITEPKVLLLDEPLSNLDAKLRVQTRMEIREKQRELGITAIYVTHDQEEAMSISDRVIVMNRGRIEQIGAPEEIYTRPQTRFVADFIGKANFIEAEVREIKGAVAVVSALGSTLNVHSFSGISAGDDGALVVRPEAIELVSYEARKYQGVIRYATYLGAKITYQVDIDGHILTVDVTNPQQKSVFSVGRKVGVNLQEEAIHILSDFGHERGHSFHELDFT